MLKRISLFFITFILCGTIGFAQNISDTQYEQLYNYCLCKYAETYLNEYYGKIHPDFGKNIGYDEIKKNLSFTIKQPLTPDNLLDILNKNNINATTRLIKDYCKNTEHNYKEGLTDYELIDKLLLKSYGTRADKVDFTNLNKTLTEDINTYLKGITLEHSDTVKTTLIEANSSALSNRRKNASSGIENPTKDAAVPKVEVDNKNGGLSFGTMMLVIIPIVGLFVCIIIRWKFWNKIKRIKQRKAIFYGITAFFVLMLLFTHFKIVRIIVITVIVIFILLFIIYYMINNEKYSYSKISKKEKYTIINYKHNYEKLKEKYQALDAEYKHLKESNNAEIKEWKRKYGELEREKDKLLNENIELGKENEAYKCNSKFNTNSITGQKGIDISFDKENIEDTFTSVLYADAIIDGYFNRLSKTPNADTIFEMHLQNAKMATFSIFFGAEQLIIKRPEFLEGCEKQVLNNAQNIRIESEGTARLNVNLKWEIIKPLNIVIN